MWFGYVAFFLACRRFHRTRLRPCLLSRPQHLTRLRDDRLQLINERAFHFSYSLHAVTKRLLMRHINLQSNFGHD